VDNQARYEGTYHALVAIFGMADMERERIRTGRVRAQAPGKSKLTSHRSSEALIASLDDWTLAEIPPRLQREQLDDFTADEPLNPTAEQACLNQKRFSSLEQEQVEK